MNGRQQEQISDLAAKFVRDAAEILETDLDKARKEFVDLYTLVPECAPEEVLKDYWANGAKEGEVPPLFSEVMLYAIFGKHEARRILGYIRTLGYALGYTDMQLRKMRK